MSEANNIAVGGDHYKGRPMEHWDFVKYFDLDYMQGNVTKYVMRHKKKHGAQDLEKALHYLVKMLEQDYGVTIGLEFPKNALAKKVTKQENAVKFKEAKRRSAALQLTATRSARSEGRLARWRAAQGPQGPRKGGRYKRRSGPGAKR